MISINILFVKLLLLIAVMTRADTDFDDIEISTTEDTAEELKIEVLTPPKAGCRQSHKSDKISIHYIASLEDGTEIESSYSHNSPHTFQLGLGMAIKGWDKGLLKMCAGERRRLTVPWHMGFGAHEFGDRVPPKATQIFEVECLSVEDGLKNVFREIDENNDNVLSRDEMRAYLKEQLAEAKVYDMPNEEEFVDQIFKEEDRNNDGIITHAEFSGLKHDEHDEL